MWEPAQIGLAFAIWLGQCRSGEFAFCSRQVASLSPEKNRASRHGTRFFGWHLGATAYWHRHLRLILSLMDAGAIGPRFGPRRNAAYGSARFQRHSGLRCVLFAAPSAYSLSGSARVTLAERSVMGTNVRQERFSAMLPSLHGALVQPPGCVYNVLRCLSPEGTPFVPAGQRGIDLSPIHAAWSNCSPGSLTLTSVVQAMGLLNGDPGHASRDRAPASALMVTFADVPVQWCRRFLSSGYSAAQWMSGPALYTLLA